MLTVEKMSRLCSKGPVFLLLIECGGMTRSNAEASLKIAVPRVQPLKHALYVNGLMCGKCFFSHAHKTSYVALYVAPLFN